MVGSGNPDKEGLREDLEDHDAEKKEAVVEEEETPSPIPSVTIASIGVVPNKPKTKQGARMSTGGKIPRRFLAPKTFPSSTKRPFHTLIRKYPLKKFLHQNCPVAGTWIVLIMQEKGILKLKFRGATTPKARIHPLIG